MGPPPGKNIVSPSCHPGTMNDQLAFLPDTSATADRVDDDAWELDEHTRQIGRQGLAAARQALRQASARLAA